MSSGYYPFSEADDHPGIQKLVTVRDALKDIIETRGGYSRDDLPAASNNDAPEDAAADGAYEAYLFLALENINKCFAKPDATPEQLRYIIETMMDNDLDEPIADSGRTMLDGLRSLAENTIGRKCKAGSRRTGTKIQNRD